jgi:hypothetical protein
MGKLRLVTLADGTTRLMSADEVRRKLASQKGGRTAARKGTRYSWNSKTAREAALKAWATRWRRLRYSGVRAGRPRHQRPPVDHAKLRAYYAKHPTLGIHFYPASNRWFEVTSQGYVQLSERSALIRLGHLPPPRKRGNIPIDDGIEVASTKPTTR